MVVINKVKDIEVPNQKQNQFRYQPHIILREEKEDKTKPVALAICEIFWLFLCALWENLGRCQEQKHFSFW